MELSVKINKTNKLVKLKKRYISIYGVGMIAWKILRGVIILGLCFVIIYPYFTKIMNSFMSVDDIIDPSVKFIPRYFTFDNVKAILQSLRYDTSLYTTFGVAFMAGILQMISTSLVGYGFARFNFKFKNILFFFVILTLIVPPQTIIISLYLKFRFFLGSINLVNSLYPILILSLTSMGIKNGLFVFILRQHFRNLPKELEEAAYIDGCKPFQTFIRIMLPSSRTMLVTVFLLAFSWQWTDVTYSSLFMKNFDLLPNMISHVPIVWSPTLQAIYYNTAAILSVLPLALVYIVGQKFFVQSVERSGIVG